jgi:hypothetical protein
MQLAVFKYQEDNSVNDFTAIEIDGQPWFVASEVCQLLDIQNSRQAIQSLDDDEKLMYTLHTSGQRRNVNLINESGLYALVFRSKKESAKKFRKWVTKEVIPSIRKTGSFGINRIETPNFVVRFNDNWDKVDRGHFSVISELFVRLYGRFEQVGYQIPNKSLTGTQIRPDTSVGKLFSTFLKTYHPEKADNYKKYEHHFPDGLVVEARQYPNEMLPIFITYIDEYWIPNCAPKYFGDRDKLALDYLPKLLGR